MRRKPFSILAVAFCTVCISATADARPFGLGGIFGLVTTPLHIVSQGVSGMLGGGGRAVHHVRGAPAHALAAPATPKQGPREAAPEPPRTEAKLEQPPSGPAHNNMQAAPQPPPAAGWPAASPSVYEDLLGYILLPRDYADRLWAHGYDDIVGAVLTPAAAARSNQAASMIARGMCSAEAQQLADKPITRLGEIIELTAAQQMALDELRAAVGQAVERGRAALCGTNSQSAGEPLKPMLDGLWTMWDATILMRAPLEKFYDSLTPEQKMQLGKAGEMAQTSPAACAEGHADPQQAALNDRIAQAIEAAAGPNPSPDQGRKLDALRQQFAELAKFLATSCPQASEPSPVSRLSAAGERMNALMYVVANMSPAVSAFQKPTETGH
jgi:hypothetical protein